MSSKNNRRPRKQQHTPKVCKGKIPRSKRFSPCDNGPAIGQSPFVTLRIIDDRGPTTRTIMIVGRLWQTSTSPTYTGFLTGQDSSIWNCHFNFNCNDKQFSWEADTTDPRWPAGPWTGRLFNVYDGPQQLDTGWRIAYPPTGTINLTGRYNIRL